MKKTIIYLISLLTLGTVTFFADIALGEESHRTWNPSAEARPKIATWIPHKQEDVLLTFEGIAMPLGRILLARKGKEYCAIKFTDTWLGDTEKDHYSSYEFFYQGDGSGDLKKSDVLSGSGELYFPRVKPVIFDMGYQEGRNTIIKCGKMEFDWLFIGWIYFEKYELAPTPWKSIKEVNVQNPKIKWFKKDRNRKSESVPIDQIWE